MGGARLGLARAAHYMCIAKRARLGLAPSIFGCHSNVWIDV
jgi:hypothetical protein